MPLEVHAAFPRPAPLGKPSLWPSNNGTSKRRGEGCKETAPGCFLSPKVSLAWLGGKCPPLHALQERWAGEGAANHTSDVLRAW